jgi:hypothetical protein
VLWCPEALMAPSFPSVYLLGIPRTVAGHLLTRFRLPIVSWWKGASGENRRINRVLRGLKLHA